MLTIKVEGRITHMRLPIQYARGVLVCGMMHAGHSYTYLGARGAIYAYLCARGAGIHDWDAESFVTVSHSRGEEPVSGDSNLHPFGNASDQNDVSHKKDHWFLGETLHIYIEFRVMQYHTCYDHAKLCGTAEIFIWG
jgi:hypothetical protein